jgi:hypothetical protein
MAAIVTESSFEVIGSVSKLADPVAVPGNTIVDIRVTERVSWVMKGGVVVE